MTWRNEYEKSVLLFTKHCIIDAKIAVRFDAEITAPENAKNTAFVIPGYRCPGVFHSGIAAGGGLQ